MTPLCRTVSTLLQCPHTLACLSFLFLFGMKRLLQRQKESPASSPAFDLLSLPPEKARDLPQPNPPSPLPLEGWSVYNSFRDLPRDLWLSVVPNDSLFLQPSFLLAVEAAPPSQLQTRYALLFQESKPVAVTLLQELSVPLENLGTDIDTSFLLRGASAIPGLLDTSEGRPVLHAIVAGQMLFSGEDGFAHTSALSKADFLSALHRLLAEETKRRKKVRPIALIGIKDLSPASQAEASTLEASRFSLLFADPAMTLHLQPEWKTFDDYLQAMSSKYRKREKDARRASKDLRRSECDAAAIHQNAASIQRLLDGVYEHASFRPISVSWEHFAQMKEALGEDFLFSTYELDGEMVGFASAFRYGQTLEAHLVGMDYRYNTSHAIYQTLLYDYVGLAFRYGLSSVRFGRTALEIKSTLGAEPEALAYALRHPSPMLQSLVSPLLRLVPPPVWTQRHPFKTSEAKEAQASQAQASQAQAPEAKPSHTEAA